MCQQPRPPSHSRPSFIQSLLPAQRESAESDSKPGAVAKQSLGIFCVALSSIAFGAIPWITRQGINAGFTTIDLLAIRFFGSAVFLLPFLLFMRKDLRLQPRQFGKVVGTALFGYGATSALLLFGYRLAPSGLVTVLHFLYPLLVMAASVARRTERATAPLVASAALATAGLALVAEPWGAAAASSLGGIALAVGSAFTFALYVIMLNDPDLRGLDNFTLVFWLGLVAGAAFLAAAAAAAAALGHGPISLARGIPAGLAMVLVPTVMAASLFSYGSRLVGGTAASVLSALEPVTAGLVGRFALGEPARAGLVAGGALVVASSLLVTRAKLAAAAVAGDAPSSALRVARAEP